MQFEYDPEQLIEEVKKRPALWNVDDQDYRSKNVKMKMWTDIVKELMSTDTTDISRSELRELELQLQKKWKSLRDCYQKYLTNPNKTRRPYLFSKQLQFLSKDKLLPKKKQLIQVGSSGESEEDEPPKKVWKTKKKLRIPINDAESDDQVADDNFYEFEETPMKSETEIRPIQVDQFAFANVDSHIKNDYEDTDKMFLLSLLPHLKSIPEEFRLNVKVELMNVLRTAHDNTTKFRFSGTSS